MNGRIDFIWYKAYLHYIPGGQWRTVSSVSTSVFRQVNSRSYAKETSYEPSPSNLHLCKQSNKDRLEKIMKESITKEAGISF